MPSERTKKTRLPSIATVSEYPEIDVTNLSPSQVNKNNPSMFFNRELSWLQFNFRVLEEAGRKDNPLLERIKFISIAEANMTEFFMVRVAGLKQVYASSVNEIQLDGRTAGETLTEVHRQAHQMLLTKYRLLDEVLRKLKDYGIVILNSYEELDRTEKKFIQQYFEKEVFRILTPLAIDPSHPFPHIANGRLNMVVTLKRKVEGKDVEAYAIVEVPSVLPRFIEIPQTKNKKTRRLIPLEEILKLHAGDLFAGTTVKDIRGFTITRNSDLSIDEVASDNLLSTIEEELKNRRWGEAVRLNYRSGMSDTVLEFLRRKLDLTMNEVYERPGMLNLHDLMDIYGILGDMKELKDRPFIPRNAVTLEKPEKIWKSIRSKDIFLHHPYDSFQTVVDFLQVAARDPGVLAIKQTLYRTSGDSPIIRSLIQAAENGKQVTVLVELKARFDEEQNIVWARELEKHGVHVVYGLVGLKIHCKCLQIIRREADGVRAYVHLATGNYNPSTAKIYTDTGIITSNQEINQDVTNLFHTMTGYANLTKMSRIATAPINLREYISKEIHREIAAAEAGKPARIRMKLNALVDPDMIILLYRASQAGVKIELNIRGICCLRPGIPGLSENINVESIVGRFLEHSRIFEFYNQGNPKYYLSSADLMPRNLNRRVEVLFPVLDSTHIERLTWILDTIFKDTHNARRLNADGTYTRILPSKAAARFSSQRAFREEANREFEELEKNKRVARKRTFQPVMNPELKKPELDPKQNENDISNESEKERNGIV